MKTPNATPAIPALPPTPVIPLSDADRAMYQDLYDTLESSLEDNANDPGAYFPLKAARAQVDGVLTKDTMYKLHENTAQYKAVLAQIVDTNQDLDKLKKEILAIDAKLARFATVVGAINKILTKYPAIIP